MLPSRVEKYLGSRGLTAPWTLAGNPGGGFSGAVVIPSLAESESLFLTLRSIAQNPIELLNRFLVLVVVNHREDAPSPEKEDNRRTLHRLSRGDPSLAGLQIAWVDAASPGLEMPVKTGGVGLARKIALDLALPRLNFKVASPLLISLDADTLCRPDYLPSIEAHFRKSAPGGAVIPFCHQPGSTEEEDRAIRRYELFLRAYVLGLSRAGSPYAFHTVGSAMACTADAYARVGGMKARSAGEDFYFLDHLAKAVGISRVKGTVVYPSARPSRRVPFGTGRSVSRLLGKEEDAVLFYQTDCFKILAEWLDLMNRNPEADGESLQSRAGKVSPHLADYLNRAGFKNAWEKLQGNFRSPPLLLKGFHDWFDGLKTLKLIHHLSAGPYPRRDPDSAVPDLLRWAGLEPLEEINPQLELLRIIQNG